MGIAPPAVAPACSAQSLAKVFGENESRSIVAVNNVTLAIRAGSFTAAIGPSGPEKSTLVHCIAGLDRAAGRSARVDSQDLFRSPERQVTKIRRDKIGFVFQSFDLFPALTTEQSILLPLELAGHKPSREVFREIVGFPGFTECLTYRPGRLPGGQQQGVTIARTLTMRPQVVFADKPTGTLDSRIDAALLQYLQWCSCRQRQTTIMVIHDSKATGYTDRTLVLSNGNIVDDMARPSAEVMLASLNRLGA